VDLGETAVQPLLAALGKDDGNVSALEFENPQLRETLARIGGPVSELLLV
jgi:hypothetical protein